MSRIYVQYSSEIKDVLRRFSNEVLKRIIIQQNPENKEAILAEIKQTEQFIEDKKYSTFIEKILKFKNYLFGENQSILTGTLNLICFVISQIEDPKEQKETAQVFQRMLLSTSDYPLPLRLKFFTCLFNSFEETNSYQLNIFQDIFNLLKEDKRLRLIYPFLKTISESMTKWEMTCEDKIQLLEKIIKSIMEISQEDQILFTLIQQYFYVLEQNSEKLTKLPEFFNELIKKLVVQSQEIKYDIILKNWKTIQWEFIMNSKCLNKLKSENSGLYNFFQIIATKNYNRFSESKKLFEDQLKFNINELDKAIKIASIVNLLGDQTQIKFSTITSSLKISQDELMEFIISALESQVIKGKIDENKEEIIIEQNTSKYFENEDWTSIDQGLKAIQTKFEAYKNSFAKSSN